MLKPGEVSSSGGVASGAAVPGAKLELKAPVAPVRNGVNTLFTLPDTPTTGSQVIVVVDGTCRESVIPAGTSVSISAGLATELANPALDLKFQYLIGNPPIASNFIQEIPGGLVTGANPTFTLASLPTSPTSVAIYIDGANCPQTPGANGFTLAGQTITFGTAPSIGQFLWAVYI